jgi:hypothetical protein
LKKRLTTVIVATLVCVGAVPFFVHDEGMAAAAQVPAPVVAPAPDQVDDSAPGTLISPDIARGAGVSPLINLDAARAAGVSADVLALAVGAIECGVASGDIAMPPTVTLIDYSLRSTDPRLWVFDTRTGALLFKELVAHGKGTGENMAVHFSDDMNSHQSSLGLFVTGDTYTGSNGYSLRLDGLEPGFNSRARERAIVMHGAPYVSADVAAKQGRLGRSWGCPALSEAVARDVIDIVRGGGVVFSYYPDPAWLARSRFLHCDTTSEETIAAHSRSTH